MKLLCGLIFLASWLYLLEATCPSGSTRGCECTTTSSYGKRTKCDCTKMAQPLTNIPKWIENNTQILSLIECNITTITKDSFKNLKNLTRIELQKQQSGLNVRDSNIFQGLNKLTFVNLAGNSISSLPGGLFANLSNLKECWLDDNPLNTLPDDLFQNSPNVATFSVAKTQLSKDILAEIGGGRFGKNLQTLSMYETRIADLKAGFFSGLPKLNTLRIRDCEINYIRANILKGTKVKRADFTGNPIKGIDVNAFAGDTVKDFKCENCELTSSVAFNGFIRSITSLTSLQLKNNQLTIIPKNAFTGLKDLIVLIDLSNNTIQTIKENAFADQKCSNDKSCIILKNNPLNCDCHLAWFRDWATEWKNLNQLICKTPDRVSGKNFKDLEVSDFCCVGNATVCGKPGSTSPNDAFFISGHAIFAFLLQVFVLLGIDLISV